MANADGAPKEQAPSVEISNLSYAFPDGSLGLSDVNLSLPPGSRTLLIGGMGLLGSAQRLGASDG